MLIQEIHLYCRSIDKYINRFSFHCTEKGGSFVNRIKGVHPRRTCKKSPILIHCLSGVSGRIAEHALITEYFLSIVNVIYIRATLSKKKRSKTSSTLRMVLGTKCYQVGRTSLFNKIM